jgi:sec-independent protein translocase protein TatB
MFDTGFWEFALIAIITLIVVGPERMPKLAKTAGKYAGKLRNFIAGAKAEIDSEMGEDFSKQLSGENLKQQLGLQDSGSVLDIIDDVQNDLRDTEKFITESTTKSATPSTPKDIQKSTPSATT